MANNSSKYKEMEFIFTIALIADAVLFVIYLIAAGFGVIWLKILTAVVAILLSAGCLVLLYFSGELLKKRSLWLSVGFAAVLVCLVFSLVLKYPSPNPLKAKDPSGGNVPAVGAMILPESNMNH